MAKLRSDYSAFNRHIKIECQADDPAGLTSFFVVAITDPKIARDLARDLLKAADDMDRTEYGEYFKRKERE